ncbi:MAG: endonuclease/exonuclease/phosphatase family protein [Bacteriovoracaceae bacterium]|nr:endonuclease/exonuclease/phosphatase family protein [Bacteriovoracaceae bacterium]
MMKFVLTLLTVTLFNVSTPANAFEIPWVPAKKDIMMMMGSYSDSSLNPENISILVWNMYKGSNETWKADYQKLIKKKDIVIAQEMYLNDNMKDTFNEHELYGYHTATSFMYLPSQTRTGVTTASYATPTSVIHQRTRVLEPVIGTPKMTLITKYELEGIDQELLVANIHSVNFVTVIQMASQLKDAAKEISKHKGPVIFAGDFNTWSPGKVSTMKKIVEEELGLTEVAFKIDNRKKVFGEIIDYIYVKGLEVIDSRSFSMEQIPGSDHTPMTANLRVSKPIMVATHP